MQIIVEIPDALAGQLHLGANADLRSLLRALGNQHVAEGGFTVVPVSDVSTTGEAILSPMDQLTESTIRPQRDVLARLKDIYGDLPMAGENAVLSARRTEKY